MQPTADRRWQCGSAPPCPARRRPPAGIPSLAWDTGTVGDRFPGSAGATRMFRVHQDRAGTVAGVALISAFRVAAAPSSAALPHRARREPTEIRATAREQAPLGADNLSPREILMQAILLHELAVRAVAAAGHLTAARSWHVLAGDVPNPAPAAPPGLAADADTILGWGKWTVLICGVAGLLVSAGKMSIGHFQSRSTMAAEAASSIPMVLVGLSLVAASAGIVGVFL